ncbi:MAG: hypothetical protein PHT98_00495, partial [Kiritimatiellae bacterium]|nr:hypothetical protein [Kiritimatiellia bacterium]
MIRLSVLSIFAVLPALSIHAASPAFKAAAGEVVPFTLGTRLFSNRAFTVLAVPPALEGARFIRADIDIAQTLTCTRPGTLYALAATEHPENSLADDLLAHGFESLPDAPFQLFGTQPLDKATLFRKTLAVGETLPTRKWVVFAAHGDLRLSLLPSSSRPLGGRENWRNNDGATLPNGIRLPRVWPPRHGDPATNAPMEVPYLDAPPEVLPIDTGRQLFVDDFLIAETTLTRTFHTATKYAGNPVFKPETALELKPAAVCYLGHGGVFYDPAERLVKMWYSAGDLDGALAFATSRDAFTWRRP